MWKTINLNDAAGMINHQTKSGKKTEIGDEEAAHIAMIKLLLPGGLNSPEESTKEEAHKHRLSTVHDSEQVNEDINMHHMLRDNLYANRTKVELSGQIKYRRLHNDDLSSFKVTISKKVPVIIDYYFFRLFAKRSLSKTRLSTR